MTTTKMVMYGDRKILDRVLSMIKADPPSDEHGNKPDVFKFDHWDTHIACDFTYPDPKPDIPALIRAWHADPTRDNRYKLWLAIRSHGDRPSIYYSPIFEMDGLTYRAGDGTKLIVE